MNVARRSALLLVAAAAAGTLVACLDDRREDTPGDPAAAIPERPVVTALRVQAAYDDTTVWVRVRFAAEHGIRQEYFHFTEGAWRREGGGFRDYQATLDEDSARGETDRNSALSETVLSVIVDDPASLHRLRDFRELGCFGLCHDRQRHMPNWRSGDGAESMSVWPGFGGWADVWSWRAHRTGLVGFADDLSIDGNGWRPDSGTAAFQTLALDTAGNPPFLFDTGGFFEPFSEILAGTDRVAFSEESGLGIPHALALASAGGAAIPSEGDAVPAQILGTPSGSRADVSAQSTWAAGAWDVVLSRALATADPSHDVSLAEGRAYLVAFAVHSDDADSRDHYVSHPVSLLVGTAGEGIAAISTTGPPDFSDETTFPVTEIAAFLPGVTSWDFLVGAAVGRGGERRDLDVVHGGGHEVATASRACSDCHATVTGGPGPDPNAGALDRLVLRRGGVFDPTPFFGEEP